MINRTNTDATSVLKNVFFQTVFFILEKKVFFKSFVFYQFFHNVPKI